MSAQDGEENRHLEVLSNLLETVERNFEGEVEYATDIADKAQKTAAVAGIFVAGTLALMKPADFAVFKSKYSATVDLLEIALFLFFACIGCSLLAMWVRTLPVGGLSVEAHEKSARQIMQAATIGDDLMAAYRENQLEVWKIAIERTRDTNDWRGLLARFAQGFLAGGIMLAVVRLVMIISSTHS